MYSAENVFSGTANDVFGAAQAWEAMVKNASKIGKAHQSVRERAVKWEKSLKGGKSKSKFRAALAHIISEAAELEEMVTDA